MYLLNNLNFDLPLTNPVIIFSLVLFIILFAPILFNKIKIPHIIGLIVAGVIVGPHGFNLLLRDSSIVLFGTVGLIYIMLTAALEIDMQEFKKNRVKSLVFGLYTFFIPIVLGSIVVYFVLGFDIPSSILVASMFSSHTLLAYPIVSRYGITRNRAVTLTIGGTIITDILALLVLAAIVGTTQGNITTGFWVKLGLSSIVFAAIVLLGFPIIARWFFKTFNDSISQYIFVLALVFLGSFLAEAAGLEAIIGAFLSGLALNKFIPHTSPLMNRIDFVGNAFFIPFFLIGVGMLVDFSVLFKGTGALRVAAVMIVMAVVTKFLAAWITQKTFNLSKPERQLIFGLSNARVGATLAVVLVGYNVILGETPAGDPIRLLNEDILNGTILMILVTCTISSFAAEKASIQIAQKESAESLPDEAQVTDKILISLAYPETVNALVDLAFLLQSNKQKAPLYALHVIDKADADSAGTAGKKLLENVTRYAASSDNTIIPVTRYDVTIGNGVIYTIKEHAITDVILGLHHGGHKEPELFGALTENILEQTAETIYIYKARQPINTLARIVVVAPPNAMHEPGLNHWFLRVRNLAKETGMPLFIYADDNCLQALRSINEQQPVPAAINFVSFNDWEEFLIFTREVKTNDLFIVVASRKGCPSYHSELEKLPRHLNRYFNQNSFLILYPAQQKGEAIPTGGKNPDNEIIEKAGKIVKKIFSR